MRAVEFIEKGIKVREKHWQDQYQQGYQRALSDIMLYIEEAKQIEKEQTIAFTNEYITNVDWSYQGKTTAQYYNEKYSK
jgi:hypothetical protein